MRARTWLVFVPIVQALLATPAFADLFFFSTGDPDGKMATASRPSSGGKIEIESADDFVVTSPTKITSATFTGLLPTGAVLTDVVDVRVEIYRIFPLDSDTTRTPNVPTRVNSPSDNALDERSASASNLTFTTATLNASFSADNSVLNRINPLPNVTTGGEGPVTGQEVEFNVLFTTPLLLTTDHYFFVPQVQLTSGDFFWLSAPRPIVSPPGTPFPTGFTDLQEWIRNEDLAPDWLRVGTDIVGGSPAPTFNAAFSLSGQTVPEPSSLILLSLGGLGLVGSAMLRRRGWVKRRHRPN